jgi:iron complex outermembrane receptor protein
MTQPSIRFDATHRLLCAAVAALAATGASAQTGATTGRLEEVIVSATRREETIQSVPITMTALTSESLAQSGVAQTSQLQQVTPGLVIARNSAIFQPTIRGIGSRAATAGDESNVAMYINGVYQAETFAGAFDLLEVERVEVLRGPQGTLFGRNSTGGLINVITKTPSHQQDGNVAVRYGSHNDRSVRGYYTNGLSESTAFDVAALYGASDGYVHDLVDGGDAGGKENYAIRSSLLMEWADNSQGILTVSGARLRDTAPQTVQPIDGNTSGRPRGANPIPDDAWESALSFNPESLVRQMAVALDTSTQFGDLDFETKTAWQKNDLRSFTDSDASTVNVAAADNSQFSETFSQEFLLSGDSDRLQWITGLFGYYGHAGYDPFRSLSNGVALSTINNENKTTSAAAFGEATWSVTDAFKVTLGARYTWEKRDLDVDITAASGARTLRSADTSFNETTPRVSLQYYFNDDTNVYATFSKGFKSGVFNGASASIVPVEPEKVDAWEVGLKSQPLSWLRSNVAAFYYDYTDIQLSQRDPNGVSILQNAGTATMKGAELEIVAAATDALNIRFAGAYLDATFDEFVGAAVTIPRVDAGGNPIGGNTQIFADASGNDAIRAPRYTMSLGVDYTVPLFTGTLTAATNVYWSDKFYWEYLNRLQQDSYALVNAQLTWKSPEDVYEVSLYGENLGDEEVGANVVTSTLGDYIFYLPPRVFGVGLKYNF